MDPLYILIVDYVNPQHGKDFSYLLNAYAEDPMGGGKALTDEVKQDLPAKLSTLPHAFSIICYVDDKR